MKHLIMLGAIAFFAASINTKADQQPPRDGNENTRLDFLCEFREKTPGTSAGAEKDFERCFAAAEIFVRRDGAGPTTSDPDTRNGTDNRLAVVCDERLIYADGAALKRDEDELRIKGFGKKAPVITLEKESSLGPDAPRTIPARLWVKGETLRGACKVTVSEKQDDDDQGPSTPAPVPR